MDGICIVCEAVTPAERLEQATVRSNVTAFRSERFRYWRCAHCQTLHARDEVELGRYYAQYPIHRVREDVLLRLLYRCQVARLQRAGVRRDHRILDYGCGGGQLVRYLRSRGFAHVAGFDEYGDEFADRKVLDRRYDCVVSQDVIEHVPSPSALLDEFARLAHPSAVIAVGTPDAAKLELSRPEQFVHELHAPYHRHILSKQALLAAGARRGWRLERFYSTMYANTPFPFLNEAFGNYYMRVAGNDLDHLVAPVRVSAIFWRPAAVFWGLFGSFFSPRTNVMAVFRAAP